MKNTEEITALLVWKLNRLRRGWYAIITARIRRMRKVMFSVCSHPGGGGGTPSQVQVRMRGGTPAGSVMGYPLSRDGGTPQGRGTPRPEMGYRTAYGVLDTQRAVCLLRSRRRIFSFLQWLVFLATVCGKLMELEVRTETFRCSDRVGSLWEGTFSRPVDGSNAEFVHLVFFYISHLKRSKYLKQTVSGITLSRLQSS